MLGKNLKFYPGLTKKYTAIFGNLFNDIWISRNDGAGDDTVSTMKVPLSYGPREKYLGKNIEDEFGTRDTSITLPRMSYEMVSMVYAPQRALNPIGKIRDTVLVGGVNVTNTVYNPVPYDLYFQMSIMTKSVEDGLKIVEQIVPFFRPEFTVTATLVDNLPEYTKDISITLTNVSNDDTYEGDFMSRRTLVWVLDFTMKAYFYTDSSQSKIIKIAFTNIYPALEQTNSYFKSTIYPGLTANGQPTTNPNTAISPLLVNVDDNWDYVIIKDDIIDE